MCSIWNKIGVMSIFPILWSYWVPTCAMSLLVNARK